MIECPKMCLGLAFLAIRHVQMGLERHNDVYRHLKILAEMVPTNFNFQYRAGMWSLDPMIAKSKEGVGFLREALYGVASVDADADENAKVEARKFFAEGLGMIGEYEEAQKELLLILKAYPLDFGVSFLLKDITYQVVTYIVFEVFHRYACSLTPFFYVCSAATNAS